MVFRLTIILMLLFASFALCSEDKAIERTLSNEIIKLFPKGDNVSVRFHNLPRELTEMKINGILISRLPDRRGEGQILVDASDRFGRRRSVYVGFRVISERRIYLAKRDMKKGEIIKPEDLYEKKVSVVDLTDLPNGIEELENRRLKKDVKMNTVITRDLLDDPYLVKRGDDVILILETEKLQILGKGISLDRGKLGDTIKVKNVSSGKEVSGYVSGEKEVRVLF